MKRPSLVVVSARPAAAAGSSTYRVARPSVRLNETMPGIVRQRRWRSGWTASVFEMQAGAVVSRPHG